MTRADSAEAPDEVWLAVDPESFGHTTIDSGWHRTEESARGDCCIPVRYVKAQKADGSAEGAALSEEELDYYRRLSKADTAVHVAPKDMQNLTAEVDRLRARERKLEEAVGAWLDVLEPYSFEEREIHDAMEALRAALEEP